MIKDDKACERLPTVYESYVRAGCPTLGESYDSLWASYKWFVQHNAQMQRRLSPGRARKQRTYVQE